MLMRLVRGDLRRNTVTTMALVALLAIATALVAAGAGTVATVSGSLDLSLIHISEPTRRS